MLAESNPASPSPLSVKGEARGRGVEGEDIETTNRGVIP